MFQNHGKTKTSQTQRERDKSTVISLSKKKIKHRKRDRKTSWVKGCKRACPQTIGLLFAGSMAQRTPRSPTTAIAISGGPTLQKHIGSPHGAQIQADLFIHPFIRWWVHRNRDRASTKPRKRQESKMGTLHGCDHLSASVSLSASNQASVWTQQRNQQCTAHFRNYSL